MSVKNFLIPALAAGLLIFSAALRADDAPSPGRNVGGYLDCDEISWTGNVQGNSFQIGKKEIDRGRQPKVVPLDLDTCRAEKLGSQRNGNCKSLVSTDYYEESFTLKDRQHKVRIFFLGDKTILRIQSPEGFFADGEVVPGQLVKLDYSDRKQSASVMGIECHLESGDE